MILADTTLAISFSRENGATRYFLNQYDDSLNSGVNLFVSSSNLYSVLQSEPFKPLTDQLEWEMKIEMAKEQLMMIAYFYASSLTYSPSLIEHWLVETGFQYDLSRRLVDIVLKARLEKVDFDPCDLIGNTKEMQPSCEACSNLNSILELARSREKAQWKFDRLHSISIHNTDTLDLSLLNETAFLIEDHHCIVVGFSVNVTEFIQLVSGYKPALLDVICSMIPYYERDHYSVGRLIIECPAMVHLLIDGYFSGLTYHGLNRNGDLALLESTCHISEGDIVPLFMKLIK